MPLLLIALVFSSCAGGVSAQKQAMSLCREAYEVYWGNDWLTVIDLSTKAIKLNPDLPWAYSQRGYAYAQLGKTDLAMDDLNMAIELDPEFGAAYFNRADLYDLLGKPELAIADYSTSIDLDPFGFAYYRRALDYITLKRYDAAETDIRKAIEFDPAPFVMITMAEVQCALESETECCDWIKKALDGGYDDWKFIEEGDTFNLIRGMDCYQDIIGTKPQDASGPPR